MEAKHSLLNCIKQDDESRSKQLIEISDHLYSVAKYMYESGALPIMQIRSLDYDQYMSDLENAIVKYRVRGGENDLILIQKNFFNQLILGIDSNLSYSNNIDTMETLCDQFKYFVDHSDRRSESMITDWYLERIRSKLNKLNFNISDTVHYTHLQYRDGVRRWYELLEKGLPILSITPLTLQLDLVSLTKIIFALNTIYNSTMSMEYAMVVNMDNIPVPVIKIVSNKSQYSELIINAVMNSTTRRINENSKYLALQSFLLNGFKNTYPDSGTTGVYINITKRDNVYLMDTEYIDWDNTTKYVDKWEIDKSNIGNIPYWPMPVGIYEMCVDIFGSSNMINRITITSLANVVNVVEYSDDINNICLSKSIYTKDGVTTISESELDDATATYEARCATCQQILNRTPIEKFTIVNI